MGNQAEVSAVILAAGTASRMGETKQLLLLNDKALLQHVIEQTLAVNFTEIITVIGHDAKVIETSIIIEDNRFRWVLNASYQDGLSSSLRKGLQSLREDSNHVMVFLGDLPFVKKSTISHVLTRGMKMAAKQREPFILRPVYKEEIGHPVFFGHISKRFFDSLTGDEGAKRLIAKIPMKEEMEVKDKGVMLDIDTYAAYQKAKHHVMDNENKGN